MKITVRVDGRPPRKSAALSLWNSPESPRVVKLRLAILEQMKKAGITDPTGSRVRVILGVSAPNIHDMGRSDTYVGDIDNFVGGVCESLQFGKEDGISDAFAGHEEIIPKKPLLILNDAQVAEIIARKTDSDSEWYDVTVETLD